MGLLDRFAFKKSSSVPAANYRVQVLLPRTVVLDPAGILAYLKSWREDVALVGNDPARFAIAIPGAGPLPIFIHVFSAPADTYASELTYALRWSQTWRDRHEAVARARHSFVVATAMESAPQLLALLAVLDTVLVSLDERDAAAAVLHWLPAQQVMPAIRYRLLRKELGPSGPVVNVRIANAGGRPGEMLADTIGLSPLGLPDLQVRFCTRDPNEVALRLMLLARRVFLGEDVPGAAREIWLAPPARDTLTIELD